jgi:hypothetical protein
MIKYSVTPPRCGWSKPAFPSQLTFLTNRTDLKPQTREKRTAGKRQKIIPKTHPRLPKEITKVEEPA